MRPKSIKKICCKPKATLFKPNCCKGKEFITLSLEETEALNLKNVIGLDQNKAAEKMGTSQSTFQRILKSANQKVSDAIVNGKEIRLEKSDCCKK